MAKEDDFYAGLVAGKKPPEAPQLPAPAVESPPEGPRPVTSKNLFTHPDTHPVVLDIALLKMFQLEWFTWLPETLFHEIEQTFKTSIAEINRQKILAIGCLHVVDTFWDKWEVFEKVVAALNGQVPRMDATQPPDLSSLLCGVDIAQHIRAEEYSDEIGRYVAACCLNENISYAPPPIEFAQPYISQSYYLCKECGKKGSALPPWDGLCDACIRRFESDTPLSFRPDPEALQEGEGRNVTTHLTIDPAPVKARFEALDKLPPAELAGAIKEVPEDIEAAKIIVAVDFQKFRAQQLQEQMKALGAWLGTA